MRESIPDPILGSIQPHLGNVTDFRFASGGCINHGGRVRTHHGDFFLKWNEDAAYPGMFEAEARGLNILSKANAIRIPRVVLHGISGAYQYLVIQFIDQQRRRSNYWTLLGERLARLHKNTTPQFGLDHDNYIGSLRQSNKYHDDWIRFFIDERLQKQLTLAVDGGKLSLAVAKSFEELYPMLPSMLPDEAPSLLHGDLWSGNLIVDDSGEPCLIDPAVYFGHREIEIAFTRLFGGFHRDFYDAYNENFRLSPGFDGRSEIYNLYPLLVHVNLFGGSYASQVVSILSRFV